MTTNEILTALEQRLPEHTIQLITATKNNGFERDGIVIKLPGVNVSPVIYIDSLDKNSDVVVDTIIDIYKSTVPSEVSEIADRLNSFSEVYENITYILINTDLNRSMLETVPHIDYLDMSLVPVIMFNLSDSNAMIKITHQLLRTWKISETTLFAMADENLYSDDYEIIDLAKYLSTMGYGVETGLDVMYVLTNKSKYYGASLIIRRDILDELCELLGDNIMLIPSSVHEWLCVRDNIEDMNMVDVIKEINTAYLDPQEILSEHPYKYAKNTDTIMIYR